jgi:hypothetical protein
VSLAAWSSGSPSPDTATALNHVVAMRYHSGLWVLGLGVAIGEIVVDFVTWPAAESFVEFNVFKYGRREGGGLVAQQYALRDYKDPRGFMRGLKPVRARLIKLMTEGGLRSPTDR